MLSRVPVLALVASSTLVLAQEVIEADSDVIIEADSSAPGQYQSGQYQATRPLTQDQYQRGIYSTGAGENTTNFMMMTVFVGYLFLMVVMMGSCFWGPRTSAPFQRFPDMEASPQTQAYKHTAVAGLDEMWRKAFVGKVYTLLCLQILVTLVVVASMVKLGGFGFYSWVLTDGAWTRFAATIATIVLIISMICYKSIYPANLILLFAFTAAMSYSLGVICTAYAANGLGDLVVEAFAITSLVFIALTIFTMQSKIDFSFLGAILPICLFTLIIWGLFSMLAFPSFAIQQTYALIGSIIFILYILYDTHAITTYLSYDDYVLGAINLYLDFINLFLMILQLLTCSRND